MNWEEDLKRGQKGEQYALEFIAREFPDAEIIEGYHPEYDIISKADNTTWEVKTDYQSKDTGNIGFEYECNGKLSGLSTTKADRWFHIYYDLGVKHFEINTDDLKHILRSNSKYLKKKTGGDNNRAKFVLVPVNNLAQIGLI